jgi:hypothetical protein
MSAWVGGKGSVYRPVDKKKYDENWDRIFAKKENLTELLKTDIIYPSTTDCGETDEK